MWGLGCGCVGVRNRLSSMAKVPTSSAVPDHTYRDTLKAEKEVLMPGAQRGSRLLPRGVPADVGGLILVHEGRGQQVLGREAGCRGGVEVTR